MFFHTSFFTRSSGRSARARIADDVAYITQWFHSILLSSKITGLRPSVQQDTDVPSSSIQGKLPPYISVITFLYKSFQAQWQNPSGMSPSSPTMNTWPSLNTVHASIDWLIGGLSPKICFVSVFFKTVIFNLPLSTIRSPTPHILANLLILTWSGFSSSRIILHSRVVFS